MPIEFEPDSRSLGSKTQIIKAAQFLGSKLIAWDAYPSTLSLRSADARRPDASGRPPHLKTASVFTIVAVSDGI